MIGASLGKYRLLAELGSGGMGTVFKAEAPDGGLVAVKVVHAHLVEQPGFRERFQREAASGRSISSPNVVRTLECLETEVDGKRVPALVLEFVEGRDLAALLVETKRVPEDLCRHLGREIARGLSAVHEAGIVHRDLKPGNVLMTTSGEVKVMDLGLARQATGEDRMSQTGLFLGTASYAPPEQFFGKKELDPRSDLYSLGAMLFEFATGRVPFQAEGIGDLVRKVLRDKPPRIGTLAPQTTPFFEEVVATLLEKEPDRRFTSAEELGEVLDAGETGDWWASASVRVQMESRKPLRRPHVRRETDLWGREDDLSELRSLWETARRGEGTVVLLEGEAGIGKTRLVEELLAAIETEDDVQILVGRHDPSGAGSAAEAFAAAFLDHLGAEDVDVRLGELLADTPLLVPAFAALLRGEPPPADAMALTPETLRTLFVHLARAFAAQSPMILVVDDLHFAGDEGRALFQAVAFAVENSPVLLLGTARPGLPAKWTDEIARRENATRREVKRLDEATVRAAVSQHLGGTFEAESVAAKVAERAGGNPYFILEVLHYLAERGDLSQTETGAWQVARVPTELALPATVRELVAERLGALAQPDHEILEGASCQGHDFEGRLVAETLSRPRMDVLRTLGRLEHATSLVRSSGTRFVFDHQVVRELLYTGQPADVRQGHHRSIAGALETRHGAASKAPAQLDGALCADLASHLFDGAEPARAMRYLDGALSHVEKRFLNERAIRLASRALAVADLVQGRERCELLLRNSVRLDLLGRSEEWGRCLEEAKTLADASGDAALRGRVRVELGGYCIRTSRQDAARSVLEEALAFCREAGDRQGESRATGNLASVWYSLGNPVESQARFERCLEIAREIGHRKGEVAATGNLGLVFKSLGRLPESQAQFERSLALAQEIGDRQAEAIAEGNLGVVFLSLGRFADARARCERWLALAREVGERRGEANATGNLGSVLLSMGRPTEAKSQFERSLALSREIGNRAGEASALDNLGAARLALGDVRLAREALETSLALSREIGARRSEGYALFYLGALADDESDLAGAIARTEESLALRRKIGHGEGVADSLIALGDLRRRAGETDAARAPLDEAVKLCGEHGRRSETARALANLACLPGGAPRDPWTGAVRARPVDEHAGPQDGPVSPGAMTAAAQAAFAEAGESDRNAEIAFLLFQATGDRALLAQAKRLLDEALEKAPREHHAAMLTSVRANREIAAAAQAAGL